MVWNMTGVTTVAEAGFFQPPPRTSARADRTSVFADRSPVQGAQRSFTGTGSDLSSPFQNQQAVILDISTQAIGQTTASQEESLPPGGLTDEELAQVERLRDRDREVRAHERAHAAVGGQYASAPTYEYETGPDGKRYAVGGSVSIDTSPVDGDPEATIEKMRIVQAAALAPAQPSAQDRAVAADAASKQRAAEAESRTQKAEEAEQQAAETK